MTIFTLTCVGEVTGYYEVIADNEEEAREIFNRGDAGEPFYTEVNGSEVIAIEKVQ